MTNHHFFLCCRVELTMVHDSLIKIKIDTLSSITSSESEIIEGDNPFLPSVIFTHTMELKCRVRERQECML